MASCALRMLVLIASHWKSRTRGNTRARRLPDSIITASALEAARLLQSCVDIQFSFAGSFCWFVLVCNGLVLAKIHSATSWVRLSLPSFLIPHTHIYSCTPPWLDRQRSPPPLLTPLHCCLYALLPPVPIKPTIIEDLHAYACIVTISLCFASQYHVFSTLRILS
jgi:hypothetical protein